MLFAPFLVHGEFSMLPYFACTEPATTLCYFTSHQLASPQTTAADTKTLISQSGTFDGAFNALADTFHVTVISEGVPYQSALDEKQKRGLSERLARCRTQEEYVNELADAYDYKAVWQSNGVCALQKRYTHDDDTMQITMGEAQHCLRSIKLLFAGFREDIDDMETVKAVIALGQNKETSPFGNAETRFSKLPPNVRPLIKNLAWSAQYMKLFPNVDTVNRRLQVCSSGTITFRDDSYQGGTYPVYEGQWRHYRGKVAKSSVAVSGVALTGDGGGTAIDTSSVNDDFSKVAQVIQNDPVIALSRKTPVPLPTSVSTIGEVAASLQKRWNGGAPLVIDAALSNKKLGVFGTTFSTPTALCQGIADLYGYRFDKSVAVKGGAPVWQIRLAPYRKPFRLEDVPGEVKRYVPVSMARAFPPLPPTITTLPSRKNSPPNSPPRISKLPAPLWGVSREMRRDSLYRVAMVPLRRYVDDDLAAAPSRRVDHTDLPASVQDDMATTSFLSLATTLLYLQDPIPAVLTHLDDANVQIVLTPIPNNPGGFTLSCRFEYPDGKTTSGISAWWTVPVATK